MATVTFDTLKFVDTLREAGMLEDHAKAISRAVRDAQETADLVTRRDLQDAVTAIRVDMQSLRADVASDMQSLRTDFQSLRSDVDSGMQSLRSGMELGIGMRTDMQSLRYETKAGMQSLRFELREIESRLTIRVGGIAVVALGAFTALSKWIG